MKNIESFRKNNMKYKIGDYVIIEVSTRNEMEYVETPTIGIIIDLDNDTVPYYVETEDNFFWRSDKTIIRRATREEIDEYEMKQNANKYNL